jgi:membrane protein DedA with SNARE-associated domain
MSAGGMEELILRLVGSGWGYAGIVGMLAVGSVGVPIPEDVPLITAGVLAAFGGPDVVTASAICFALIVGRDFGFYWLGRRYGLGLLSTRWGRRLVPADLVERMRDRLKEHGVKVVAAGRFAVGVRTAIFFAAGLADVPPRRFLLADGLAALLSVPLWVGLGWLFAENLGRLEPIVRDVRLAVGLATAAGVGFFLVRWWRRRAEGAA